MNSRVKWGLVFGLALAAAWGGIEFGRWSRTPTTSSDIDSAKVVAQLLTTPLITLTGKSQTLENWKGKVIVVNFWATWCPPCREEMPELSRLQDQLGPNGVQFVGIAIDEASNVAQFTKTTPVSYVLLIGTPESPGLMAQLGNRAQGLPFTVIIDRQGKLSWARLGRLDMGELNKQLATLP